MSSELLGKNGFSTYAFVLKRGIYKHWMAMLRGKTKIRPFILQDFQG